jgi:hypothetical protein
MVGAVWVLGMIPEDDEAEGWQTLTSLLNNKTSFPSSLRTSAAQIRNPCRGLV